MPQEMRQQKTQKTQEERVRDAIAVLDRGVYGCNPSYNLDILAREVLEAADREGPPTSPWPTDESVRAYFAAESPAMAARVRYPSYGEQASMIAGVRAALLADPIVMAAVTVSREVHARGGSPVLFGSRHVVYEAVRDAGLLEGDS